MVTFGRERGTPCMRTSRTFRTAAPWVRLNHRGRRARWHYGARPRWQGVCRLLLLDGTQLAQRGPRTTAMTEVWLQSNRRVLGMALVPTALEVRAPRSRLAVYRPGLASCFPHIRVQVGRSGRCPEFRLSGCPTETRYTYRPPLLPPLPPHRQRRLLQAACSRWVVCHVCCARLPPQALNIRFPVRGMCGACCAAPPRVAASLHTPRAEARLLCQGYSQAKMKSGLHALSRASLPACPAFQPCSPAL